MNTEQYQVSFNQNENRQRVDEQLQTQIMPHRYCHIGERRNQSETDLYRTRFPRQRQYGFPDQQQLPKNDDRFSPYARSTRRRATQVHSSSMKIPAFHGKDDWKVWINRFEAVALHQGWDNEEKLGEILPKLQGSAGEFVFTQLRQDVLTDYNALISELDCRFRVIETAKTFAAQFSHRDQKPNETA